MRRVDVPEHDLASATVIERTHRAAAGSTACRSWSRPRILVLIAVAPTTLARIAVAVYVVALIAVFWVSSTYHRNAWSVEERARWQRRDHAAIYLLIAGTYTPFCLLALDGPWRAWLLSVWLGAAVGILVKIHRVDLHVLSGVLYLGLGWVAVVAFPRFVDPPPRR